MPLGRELIESMDAYVCEQPLQYSMIHAIQVLREKGVKTCAVTNNWYSEDVDSSISNTHNNNSKKNKHSQPLSRIAQKWLSLQCAFDAFVESRVVGISKPDPQIYHIACEKLGVTNYSEVVFLDDIGMYAFFVDFFFLFFCLLPIPSALFSSSFAYL